MATPIVLHKSDDSASWLSGSCRGGVLGVGFCAGVCPHKTPHLSPLPWRFLETCRFIVLAVFMLELSGLQDAVAAFYDGRRVIDVSGLTLI